MTDLAIRVEGLSKRYRLGPREPYKTAMPWRVRLRFFARGCQGSGVCDRVGKGTALEVNPYER